jgi:hypothetical protein
VVNSYNSSRPTYYQGYYRDWGWLGNSDTWYEKETMPNLSSTDQKVIALLLQTAKEPTANPAQREATLSNDRMARVIYVPGTGRWEDIQQQRVVSGDAHTQQDAKRNWSTTTTTSANIGGGVTLGEKDVAGAGVNAGYSSQTVKQNGGEQNLSTQQGQAGSVSTQIPHRMSVDTVRIYIEISDTHYHTTYYPIGTAHLIDMRAGHATP